MFNTTLRYLNLIILPHPSFDIPLSEADPEFQTHGRKGDIDTSYISQNQISQYGPIELSTPVLKTNLSHERRRNTICCYPCHLADSFPANEDVPMWPVNTSFNSFLSSDTSRYPFYEDVPVPPTSTGVKIVTPHDSPSPSSSWVKQPRITSFVDFSDLKKVGIIKENASKGKEKRNSAPAAVNLGKERFNEVIDITSTKDTTQSHPAHLRMDQRPKPHTTSISPYTSKHFEIGLSPIVEDTPTFANTLRGPKSVEKKPGTSDTVDSSESSYGELIQKKTINYLSTSEYEYGTFGELVWENQERNKQPLSFPRFNGQDYAHLQGDRYWNDEFWETFEDSSLIPELTLTAPTPEMATSAKFRSEGWPCEFGPDYQLPEANVDRPSRLGYTTALASISKAFGTGADMLLGVGDGVFDDMLDNSCGASQLPASAAHGHLGDDWLGSLAAQPLGKSQAETGFLGQLLRRRKGTGSQISECKDRVWQRVSRIFHSSRRSSRSAHDQAKNTVSAPLAANEPRNASRGWKRYSHILRNVTVSSRRRSAGDQVQFTVDRACNGLSDFGSTRRHGLDIPSESAEQVCEHWVGSMDRMARPERTFFGARFLDHEPRRQSFGLDFGMRISKRRWWSSADGPTEDERIRNRYERHIVVY